MDAYVALEAKVSGSISNDTHYAQLVPMKYRGVWGEDYTCEPSFFAKENEIDLDFNEVVGSNHMTVACDVLPTLKQGANTNQVYFPFSFIYIYIYIYNIHS